MQRMSLNGRDWVVMGRLPNQVQKKVSMELGLTIDPYVDPIPATVPGAVQLDLMAAGRISDPHYGRKSEECEWVNNREWHYQKTFTLPAELRGFQRYEFHFKGLDTCGEIYLNKIKIADFEDFFLPQTIDVTGRLLTEGENVLDVMFRRSPEVDCMFGHTSRTKIFKPRFCYTWDWCPRMVPVGIWDDVELGGYNSGKLLDFYPKTGDESIAVQTSFSSLLGGDYTYTYTITGPNGHNVTVKSFSESLPAGENVRIHTLDVPHPALWYPNGRGEQPLYTVALAITSAGMLCDNAQKRVGFRTLAFSQNDNAPAGALPYTLSVNGERLFLCGANWVPPSMYFGGVTYETYRRHLLRFKEMNCNILRVWAGSILEKEMFYDLCDELGIMVWQEFPQTSSGIDNLPPSDDPVVLDKLHAIASRYILEKRHHASHVIWCGGNELMTDDYIPVDSRHRGIHMLGALVKELDPDKQFLPCSASGPSFCADESQFGRGMHHDVHGPWRYLGVPDQYRFFNHDDALFRSETGAPGAESYASLLKYADGLPVWPPVAANIVWSHPSAWWVLYDDMQHLFGGFDEESSLPRYIESTRYLQMEGLRYASEATRRREGEAAGYIIWMGNEPFPNPCNTSVLEYDNTTPKPAYYALQNAYSNLFASLRYDTVCYPAGASFHAEAYLHDILGTGAAAEITVLDGAGKEIFHMAQDCTGGGKGVRKIGDIDFIVPSCEWDLFFVRLSVNGVLNNQYIFNVGSDRPFGALRALADTAVTARRQDITGAEILLANESSIPAVGILLTGDGAVSPNYITLLPGEKRTVSAQGPVTVSGYNLKKPITV